MGVVSLTIPLNVKTKSDATDVALIIMAAAGTSDVAVDPTAGKVTLNHEFPGDIDPLMQSLYERGLVNTATVAVSVPVRPEAGAFVNGPELVARLNAARAVSNASYDGKAVNATIAAATEALDDLHERIVAAGLVLP